MNRQRIFDCAYRLYPPCSPGDPAPEISHRIRDQALERAESAPVARNLQNHPIFATTLTAV